MKKRILLCCLFTGLLSLSSFAGKSGQPNVLVILLDDLGYNDLGFTGSPHIQTPNIDRLAMSGVVCRDAHVSGTTCSPSRAGIMTGRYQQRFGHHRNSPPQNKGMDVSEKTIGDAFRAIDYETIYIGKWHLGSAKQFHPNVRGWNEFYGLRGGSRSYFYNKKEDHVGSSKQIEHNGENVKWEGYLTDLFTEKALSYLDQNTEKPFFMFLSYTAPHTPMHAKKEYLQKFADNPRKTYAAMMWSVDEGVGQILEKLEALHLRENTLIYFLSDNGGASENDSNNAPYKGDKGTKYEGGQRTPFLVSWPAEIPAGGTYDGLVSALDIFATSASVAGAPLNLGKPLDGVNLIPYLKGEKSEQPHDFLFWHRGVEDAVRMGDYKLIGHQQNGWVLYNLAEDEGETKDLSSQLSEIKQEMMEALDTWKTNLVQPHWSSNHDWEQVKVEYYRALMNNEAPRYTTPPGMRRYLRKNKEKESQDNDS